MTGKNIDVLKIEKIAEDWNDGWRRNNLEKVISLYADDAVLMPQGQPAITGKNAIRPLYESFFGEFTIEANGKVIEVEVSGDLGYFWSSYTLTATPKKGSDEIKSQGKSIFIVRRQNDDSWKISRLIDNSDTEY